MHRNRAAQPRQGGHRDRGCPAPAGGVDVSTLAKIPVVGNGHTMMLERNNEQIADLIERWINQHVPHVRGRSHR